MIVIDAFNMIYRAAVVACSIPEEEYLYGDLHKSFLQIFFKMFNRIYRNHKNEQIIIAWENNVDNFRKELFPEYKSNRSNSLKEQVEGAFEDIKEALRYYGCRVLEHNKAEGDDIIYAVCQIIWRCSYIKTERLFFLQLNQTPLCRYPHLQNR